MIWTNRNKVIFENKIADVQQVISSTRNLLTKWKADLDDCIQIGSTIAVTIGNQIPCQNQNWQAIIIVDTKKCSCKANRIGGAFVIKNRFDHFVRKGCYSWHSCNDENNQLSTIREALYKARKQGFKEIILFLKSNQGVKLIQTHRLTSFENVPIMDDITTLKKMIRHIHIVRF